jgi:hypothetical protein
LNFVRLENSRLSQENFELIEQLEKVKSELSKALHETRQNDEVLIELYREQEDFEVEEIVARVQALSI